MSSTNKKIILFEYRVLLNKGTIELERSILHKEDWERVTIDLSENENILVVANFLTHLKKLSEDLDTSLSTYF